MVSITNTNSNPFRSSRLLYRAIDSPQDDEIFHDLHKNPETYKNADPGLPIPPGRKRTTFLRQFYQNAMLGVLICAVKGDGDDTIETPVGALSLSNNEGSVMAYHRKAELTISIAPAYQNKGYGTEAMKWTLDWAFRKANLHRVSLQVVSYNDGAIRFYKNLGFKVESVEKESLWHDNGWHGILGMAMLDHEWDEIRKGDS